MVLPEPARLSVQALTLLLEVEQIGEPHLVLAPTAVCRPPADQDELHVEAREEITALGWYDRRKRLEIEMAVALAILCRAESEFFGWITRGQATVGVLAAGIGRHGLLAVRDGDSVWLNHTGRNVLAEALVGQTPNVSAGPGKAGHRVAGRRSGLGARPADHRGGGTGRPGQRGSPARSTARHAA